MKKLSLLLAILLFVVTVTIAQQADTLTNRFNFHFQLTAINQSHPAFHAPYSGKNSLQPDAEQALSLTTTMFMGARLWKGASVYFNPEISGGRGFSSAVGVAGFPNGETFRIGNSAPALYLARLFYRQYIALGKEADTAIDNANQITELVPRKRITITAGKFAIADLFDNNSFSHDPRTQFMNWSLMSAGAWDYPANTRGYTDGLVLEYITPGWALRVGTVLVPTYANGPDFDYNYTKAHGEVAEIQKNFIFGKRKGTLRILGFRNVSKAANYREVINGYINHTDSLDVINGRKYGGVKYGFSINGEQELTNDLGFFFRGSWNDGQTATWAFTEIDRSGSIGLSLAGSSWHRPDDTFGIAAVINGISAEHRAYLAIGGYGFMIGDGRLNNYKTENILETYYSANVNKYLKLSLGYQFIQNPAYNGDRGPVNVFSVRAHVVI
ncbi:high affinity Mn2+ porin [Mucilaginibacter oryzae]|uniref:High affinity Mn2+ porin n=1 Tax=Mucilaginibacter oryzae TaxID=468058 RepID=A0A316HGS1_9SPHI|nr:carbohydrate porin [Mucilaginibacter oryzae]PWK80419.1 high affinity Mn2+ porin [Mucilaginibacter oryzae]